MKIQLIRISIELTSNFLPLDENHETCTFISVLDIIFLNLAAENIFQLQLEKLIVFQFSNGKNWQHLRLSV